MAVRQPVPALPRRGFRSPLRTALRLPRPSPRRAAPREAPSPKPDAGSVRGLALHYLEEQWAPRLPPGAWDEVRAAAGLPDPRRVDPFDTVPAQAFVATLHGLDARLGRGDGALLADLGRGWAHAWARAYRSLAARLATPGDARAMLEVLAAEVHPWLLEDPDAARLVDAGPRGAVLELRDPFPEAFRTGLLEGFAEVAGAPGAVAVPERPGSGRYAVGWEDMAAGPATAGTSHLRRGVPAVVARALRLPSLGATVVPVLAGLALAWKDDWWDPALAGLTLLGVAALHLAANAINDWFDHRSHVDEANPLPTPYSGGSRVIQRRLLSARGVLALALAMYALGAAAGVAIAWQLQAMRGEGLAQVLGFGLAGALLGFLYSAPPARLAHRGLGELAVGLGFGPLLIAGTYVVQSLAAGAGPYLNPEALLYSVPIGALVAAVLYVNELPDRPWDARAGKRTLAVRLGTGAGPGGAPRALLAYGALLALAYGSVVAAALLLQAWPVLLALLTAPLAWRAWRVLRAHDGAPYRLAPASRATVLLHLGTGLLLVSGILLLGGGV